MNERQLPSGPQVEQWVRDYLTARERSVNAREILAGVRERLVATTPEAGVIRPGPRLRRVGRWVWGMASAAAILLAAVLAFEFGPSPASAETLIVAAKARAEEPVDRCYSLRMEMDPELHERDPLLPPQREGELWTRGNQLYMKPTHARPNFGWGRDDKGRVWFAVSRQVGVRFQPDEVPPLLARTCDLRSMQVETLLRELLTHFDLTREGPVPGETGPVQIVRALLKPEHGHKSLRGARLEIDARSNVLRRVILYHNQATLTFTLVRTAPLDDTRYQLETYLDPDAKINAHAQPLPRRLEMLRRYQKNVPPADAGTNGPGQG